MILAACRSNQITGNYYAIYIGTFCWHILYIVVCLLEKRFLRQTARFPESLLDASPSTHT